MSNPLQSEKSPVQNQVPLDLFLTFTKKKNRNIGIWARQQERYSREPKGD